MPSTATAEAPRAPCASRHVYTVTQLNRAANDRLADSFASVWVEGEVSNVAQPKSGHLYFTLKDERAQIQCALFRQTIERGAMVPTNGMQARVSAKASVFAPRGTFQLLVQSLEPAGEGALRIAYERLRAKLQDEGLFDRTSKRPIPDFPRSIGVVTSPNGAAIRDVIKVLARRLPSLPIRVYPTRVQGTRAADEARRMIDRAAFERACDVLLVVRGGGSAEDLASFNDEGVARAIAACPIPIISGIGHESDTTIADFAADQRAPTPSAAAELASPDRFELAAWLDDMAARKERAHANGCERRRQMLALNAKGLRDPRKLLDVHAQRLDDLEARCARAALALRQHAIAALEQSRARLRHPSTLVADARAALGHLATRRRRSRRGAIEAGSLGLAGLAARCEAQRLRTGTHRTGIAALRGRAIRAVHHELVDARTTLGGIARTVHAIHPDRILERGYAIVRHNGAIVRDALALEPGDVVETRLARGTLEAIVSRRT